MWWNFHKNPKWQDSESFWVGEDIKFLGGWCSQRGYGSFAHIYPIPSLMHLFYLAISELHPLFKKKKKHSGTSLAVQWLRLHASIEGGMDSISGQGTKIPRATRFSHRILLINHKIQVKCSLSFRSCSGKWLNLKGRGPCKPPTLQPSLSEVQVTWGPNACCWHLKWGQSFGLSP